MAKKKRSETWTSGENKFHLSQQIMGGRIQRNKKKKRRCDIKKETKKLVRDYQ